MKPLVIFVLIALIAGCSKKKPIVKPKKLYSYKLYIDDKLELNKDSVLFGKKATDTLQFLNDSLAFSEAADKLKWKKLINDIFVSVNKNKPNSSYVSDSGKTFKILNHKGQDLKSILSIKFTDSVEKAENKSLTDIRHESYIEEEYKKIHPDNK
ncbi:hypothetical protein ACVW0P_004504 [Mucilaginibacter sp. UYNi724]